MNLFRFRILVRGGSSTEINYTIRLNLFGKIARQEETIKTLNNSLLVLGRFYNRSSLVNIVGRKEFRFMVVIDTLLK